MEKETYKFPDLKWKNVASCYPHSKYYKKSE